MKFIPFIKKNRAVDYTAATELARTLADSFRLSPGAPQWEIKGLIANLGETLKTESTVVIGVSKFHYLKLKKALSMVFKAELFEAVSVKSDVLFADEDAHELQYCFIKGSKVFKSVDGLYSGYGIQGEEQKIIVLPLNEERYKPMLAEVRRFVFGEEAKTQFTLEQQAKKRVSICSLVSAVLALASVVLSLGVGFYFIR